jgi:hypothetical protein
MNLGLIFALTSLFSRELCLAANLNRYPVDVICLFEFSPLFDPGGFVFVGAAALGGSTVFRASAPSRGFIFRAQALRPVAAAQTGPEAAHLLHNPKMSVPGMTSTDGTGEARRTSYRLRCAGPLPVLQSQNVVRLEFSGSFGLMQRGSGLRSSKAISGDAAERPTGPA